MISLFYSSMVILGIRSFLLLLVCLCQITVVITSRRLNYQIARKNNNNIRKCLSSLLPPSTRTIYPCSTLINQYSFEYQCDHFNVTSLSSIRGARIFHTPAVIVYARNSSDVQNVVKCAAELDYVVNALSRGHSYERYGLGSVYNNIVINLGAINHMQINRRDRTGTFGAGARIGPIYYETYQHDQYTINAGSCGWVGLGGQALGGGYGYLARLHGLLADNVLEMKAVNAQGELLTINATHEPQLYWALRGSGGGSFVIVTEFKIQLIKSPSLVTKFTSTWYPNATKRVIRRYQSLVFNNKTVNLSNNIFVSLGVNKIQVGVTILYFGPQFEEFNRVISLLLATLPAPNKTEIHEQDWLTFIYQGSSIGKTNGNHRQLLLDQLSFPTYYFKAKHLFYDHPISDHSLDQFIDRLQWGDGELSTAFNPWDGYLRTIPVDQTAFPHRQMTFGTQFMVSWQNAQEERRQMTWLKQVYLSLYNDSTKHSYVNYMDRDVHSWMSAYYHTHQQRLIQIKNLYDRTNRFYFEKSIK